MSIDSDSLNHLSQLYSQYTSTSDDKKADLIKSKWIHTDLTISDKGLTGSLLNKWSLTRDFYRNREGINFETTLQTINNLRNENLVKPLDEQDQRVEDAYQLILAYITHINFKDKRVLKLQYATLYLHQIGQLYGKYESAPTEIDKKKLLEETLLHSDLRLSKPSKIVDLLHKGKVTRGLVQKYRKANIAKALDNLNLLKTSLANLEKVPEGFEANLKKADRLLTAYVTQLNLKPKNWDKEARNAEYQGILHQALSGEAPAPQEPEQQAILNPALPKEDKQPEVVKEEPALPANQLKKEVLDPLDAQPELKDLEKELLRPRDRDRALDFSGFTVKDLAVERSNKTAKAQLLKVGSWLIRKNPENPENIQLLIKRESGEIRSHRLNKLDENAGELIKKFNLSSNKFVGSFIAVEKVANKAQSIAKKHDILKIPQEAPQAKSEEPKNVHAQPVVKKRGILKQEAPQIKSAPKNVHFAENPVSSVSYPTELEKAANTAQPIVKKRGILKQEASQIKSAPKNVQFAENPVSSVSYSEKPEGAEDASV